jgi:hypothetical protein
MAKATKGSADSRNAAGDLSTRDQTTAIPRSASHEPAPLDPADPAGATAARRPATVSRAPNGRFISTARRGDAAATSPAARRGDAAATSSGTRLGNASAPRSAASAGEPKVTLAANQTRPRKATATSRTGSTAKGSTPPARAAGAKTAPAGRSAAPVKASAASTPAKSTASKPAAGDSDATTAKTTRSRPKSADDAAKPARTASTRTRAAKAGEAPVKASRSRAAMGSDAEPTGRGKAAGTKADSAAPPASKRRAPQPKAETAEKKPGTTARRARVKAAAAGESAPVKAAAGESALGKVAAGEGAAVQAAAAGEGAAPQEPAAAPKVRSTKQPKAQPDPAAAIEVTDAAASGPTEITTETTETVDLRAPEAPEPETAAIAVRPATDGATSAEADGKSHRAPARTGGVVSPTRAPGHGPASTHPASTGPAATRPPARPTEDVRPAGARTVETADNPTMQARRRRTMLLVFVVVAIVVVGVSLFVRQHRATPPTVVPAGSQLPPVPPTGAPTGAALTAKAAPPADAATTGPSTASGRFTYVSGYGPLMGTGGTLRRFKVAVESTIGQGNGGDVADEIDSTLGDPRSWIAGLQVRLQRVPQQADAEFTIYLASAQTSERMCGEGGLLTKGYTSCRLPGQVILNEARWDDAVPGYGAPIATYRAYAINHEVGHELGHGHEACPGDGRPAPVMQQQTYGLNGCVANAWPYIDDRRYSGPPMS